MKSRSSWGGWWSGSLVLLAGLAVGCAPANKSIEPDAQDSSVDSGNAPISIFCTTGQVADALRNIAGEHAEVSALMGPGVDPHLFRPKPSDVQRLRRADIVFYNGLHLEGRIVETLEKLAEKKPVFAVTAKLVTSKDPRLRQPTEFEGHYDPHVWHDVRLWSDCVAEAADQLAKFDPKRAADYQANAAAYRKELEQLDAECRAQLDTLPANRRLLVTAHDAFGYFSNAYDLKTIGLKGISTDDEADFQHLDEVRRILVESDIPAVFVESSTSRRLVNQLIEACGAEGHKLRVGEELYSDAMGAADSGAEDYVGMIRANVKAIVDGLAGE